MTNAPTGNLTRADGSSLCVLVVDDEQMLANLLASALCYERWEVIAAGTGTIVVCSTQEINPDVVALNIMLPDLDDLGVMRRVCGHRPDASVLLLTAKGAVEDHVTGLAAGGDDYATEPFSLEEIVTRLRVLLHRSGASEEKPTSILEVGGLHMSENSHEVWCDGDEIRLIATELELLHYLMRNPCRVLPKLQILGQVWNCDFDGQANIVEFCIPYLRRRIDKGHEPMIRAICSVGYVLKPAAGIDERG